MLSDVGLLEVICPELEDCKNTPQDKFAAQNVFEHSLATLDATPADDLVLRLAGLFHDIGKPETFADGHFHQHEFVGEFKARQILRRWKFDKETVAEVTHLIRNHMFWYETHWTDSAVRRFIRKVGLDNIPALFALRRADNIGSGARSPRMHALEALWQRVEKEIAGCERVLADATSRSTGTTSCASSASRGDQRSADPERALRARARRALAQYAREARSSSRRHTASLADARSRLAALVCGRRSRVAGRPAVAALG